MKITKDQKRVIDKAKELEKAYGTENVFVSYISAFDSIRFIIHRRGDSTFNVITSDSAKVHERILNSLDKKGMLTCCDIMHNEGVDPNSWRSQPAGWRVVGSRIKTELIEN